MKKLLFYGLMMFILSSCSKGEIDFKECELLPVKISNSDYWSMLDPEGNIVYESEFSQSPTTCYNGIFVVPENDGYTVYRRGNKRPELVGKCEGLKAAGVMNEGLMPVVFPDERISVINSDGEKQFTLEPYKGTEIVQCATYYTNGLLAVQLSNGKWGYVDTKGEMVIKPAYDICFKFSENFAVVGKNNNDYSTRYYVIDTNGEVVFKLKSSQGLGSYSYKDGYLVAEQNKRIVFLDKKGEVAKKLPAKAKYISDYNKDYIIFSNGDNHGVMDFDGEVVVRAKYAYINFLDNNTFICRKDDKDESIVINTDGEQLESYDYRMVINLQQFGLLGYDNKTYTYTLFDREGKSLCKEDFCNISNTISHFVHLSSDYSDPKAYDEEAYAFEDDSWVVDTVAPDTAYVVDSIAL